MRNTILYTVTVFFMASCNAYANSYVDHTYVDGNSLLRYYEADSGPYSAGLCIGYIIGVADTLGMNNYSAATACYASSVVTGQIRDVVISYLKSHPESRHYAADGVVALAISEAFPCQ